MRSLALVAMLACGREEKPSQAPPARVDDGRAKKSIDVTVAGADVAIRGVELGAGPRPGELVLGYRIESKVCCVPAVITCRVGDRNIVYPTSTTGKVAGARLSARFLPDPFTEAPRVCEVAFWVRTSDDARGLPIGHACWQGGVLRDGACDKSAFPAPVLREQRGARSEGAVALERASLELRDATAVVTGLFTVVAPLPPERRFVAAIACEDRSGRTSGEAALPFVPLETLEAGMSIYGPLTIPLERTPSPDAHCELSVADARYCITIGSVSVGPC